MSAKSLEKPTDIRHRGPSLQRATFLKVHKLHMLHWAVLPQLIAAKEFVVKSHAGKNGGVCMHELPGRRLVTRPGFDTMASFPIAQSPT
ncbi:MAG TPA: hypothetical protein VFB96_09485 [Pirellulaceae bacterium]|nr:hypothetical protein [Pirellulaceae bacterium]